MGKREVFIKIDQTETIEEAERVYNGLGEESGKYALKRIRHKYNQTPDSILSAEQLKKELDQENKYDKIKNADEQSKRTKRECAKTK